MQNVLLKFVILFIYLLVIVISWYFVYKIIIQTCKHSVEYFPRFLIFELFNFLGIVHKFSIFCSSGQIILQLKSTEISMSEMKYYMLRIIFFSSCTNAVDSF